MYKTDAAQFSVDRLAPGFRKQRRKAITRDAAIIVDRYIGQADRKISIGQNVKVFWVFKNRVGLCHQKLGEKLQHVLFLLRLTH
jgi:hypothetical protein